MDEKKIVLIIIDDDESVIRTLSLILGKKGYETEAANSGREALEKAQRRFFNVALIDIKLPDMSGIEVLKTFRNKYPSMMNIMITGYSTLQNTMDALNLEANAYLTKPIDHERLDQAIKECLKKQQEALKISRGTLSKELARNLKRMQQEGLNR
jgi:DNA-binding NtrC family response regulator